MLVATSNEFVKVFEFELHADIGPKPARHEESFTASTHVLKIAWL